MDGRSKPSCLVVHPPSKTKPTWNMVKTQTSSIDCQEGEICRRGSSLVHHHSLFCASTLSSSPCHSACGVNCHFGFYSVLEGSREHHGNSDSGSGFAVCLREVTSQVWVSVSPLVTWGMWKDNSNDTLTGLFSRDWQPLANSGSTAVFVKKVLLERNQYNCSCIV